MVVAEHNIVHFSMAIGRLERNNDAAVIANARLDPFDVAQSEQVHRGAVFSSTKWLSGDLRRGMRSRYATQEKRDASASGEKSQPEIGVLHN